MGKRIGKQIHLLPIIIEHDEDGFVVATCPVFEGCYSQGKTVDEALKNVREVIDLLLEESENKRRLRQFGLGESGIHTIAVTS